jgi:hypothetical protein
VSGIHFLAAVQQKRLAAAEEQFLLAASLKEGDSNECCSLLLDNSPAYDFIIKKIISQA